MKKFILAFRDFKKLNNNCNLKPKLCWFHEENKWFVSVVFSEKYILSRNLEVCNG